MIERSDLDDNALEISSTAHTIRVLVHGDKTYFSAVDILKACGIKAPTKWMERNTSDRPDIVTSKLEYPVKTTQGYRRVKLNFDRRRWKATGEVHDMPRRDKEMAPGRSAYISCHQGRPSIARR